MTDHILPKRRLEPFKQFFQSPVEQPEHLQSSGQWQALGKTLNEDAIEMAINGASAIVIDSTATDEERVKAINDFAEDIANMSGSRIVDGVWAAGNYSVTIKDKTIEGNWFRILKRESGTWKIAMQSFARSAAMDGPLPLPVPHQRPPTTNRKAERRVEWAATHLWSAREALNAFARVGRGATPGLSA